MIPDLVNKLLAALDGKKTYLAAAGYLGFALYQIVVLKDVPGAGQSVLAALGLFGLRQAVAKGTGA